MYTNRQLKNDIYQLTTHYRVKYALLQKVVFGDVSEEAFVQNYIANREDFYFPDLLADVQAIKEKIRKNGGSLSPDPVEKAKSLRKAGKLEEAFHLVSPLVKNTRVDSETKLTFGWIMYDYMKKTEGKIPSFIRCLKFLNENITFNILKHPDGVRFPDASYEQTLVNQILWSIRRVVNTDKTHANKLLPELLKFVNHKNYFLKSEDQEGPSASRFLVKDIRKYLTDENYFKFMDVVGFNWFSTEDYEKSFFVNEQGEHKEVTPLAEKLLSDHAKRLEETPIETTTPERVDAFINDLDGKRKHLSKYEYLPYYQAKLLKKVKRKEEAFAVVTPFARRKTREPWLWEFVGSLLEGNDRFYALCAAILCKSPSTFIEYIQSQLIPLLLEREIYAQAKYEVDQIILVRRQKNQPLNNQLKIWLNTDWYKNTNASSNRFILEEYAEKATELLYRTLSYTDIFVNYINEEKQVIHFIYKGGSYPTLQSGYFYSDALKEAYDWRLNEMVKVKMLKDERKKALFHIYEVTEGDESVRNEFITEDRGYVEKKSENPFAFVNDVYIHPKLVKKYELEHNTEIQFVKRRSFNRKKKSWGWEMVEIILSDEILNL